MLVEAVHHQQYTSPLQVRYRCGSECDVAYCVSVIITSGYGSVARHQFLQRIATVSSVRLVLCHLRWSMQASVGL